MRSSRQLSSDVLQKLDEIAARGFQNAARGMSGLIGHNLVVLSPQVSMVPLKQIPEIVGGAETDAVGIYLKVEGGIGGQVMLVIPYGRALEIVDLMMDVPSGTTTSLGRMERSALAEVGNMTGTFFLNAVAEFTDISSRPSPPAVMVDMLGAIMDVIIATMGEIGDEVMMFQATFVFKERESKADFWIIPDPYILDIITTKGNK